jgi:hypothetical protein
MYGAGFQMMPAFLLALILVNDVFLSDVTMAMLLMLNSAILSVPCYMSFPNRQDVYFLRASVVPPKLIFVLIRVS